MSDFPVFHVYGLKFVMTCFACPEQYDIFLGDEEIGYFRLRHGFWSCRYGGIDGPEIEADQFFLGDGNFLNAREREAALKRAAVGLLGERMRRLDQSFDVEAYDPAAE